LCIPNFRETGVSVGDHVDSLRGWPRLAPPPPPRKNSWYSFMLEAESTPGPRCVNNVGDYRPVWIENRIYWTLSL
jgi:hypothetical protein